LTINTWMGEPQSLGARLAVLATFAAVGVVEGGALAALQWRVLRSRLPRLRAGEWIGVTVAVAVAGWIAGMTPSLFVSHAPASVEPQLGTVLSLAAIAGGAAGLCFGAGQWFVLRRHAKQAHQWIRVHVPAWALAMSAIFLGASLPSPGSSGWFIALSGVAGGVVGGLLLGAVTGVVARGLTPWVDEQHWLLQGHVVVVTGANSGLGREIALGLARLGAAVILLCRRAVEGERVRQCILAAQPNADVSVVACDLSDFRSIRCAAAQLLSEWPRLDVLVHNAGATFPQRTLTADGVEATLAVYVVGPFLLTVLLRQRLESCRGRVITLTGIYQRKGRVDTSDLHFAHRPYDWLVANHQAQRGRWLFMAELARRAPELMTASVHPGAVLTGAQARLPRLARALVYTLARPGFVRPEVGAIPVLRLAAHPDLQHVTGRFFDRCHEATDVADPALAQAFWAACEDITGERWPSEEPPSIRSRRVVVTRYGGPEVLQIVEGVPPEPRAGEARVRILATGVSYADLLMREGVHPEAPRPPFTLGWDLVGVIDRLGAAVEGLALNQRVAALSITGGCADFICLPAEELVPVPTDVDLAEAAALVFNYVTAYQMLHRSARVRPGERVLIHGAAGGIGTALLQLGRLADLRMYGTARQPAHAVITNLGATPIDFERTNFVNEVRRATGDGVDVVFDGIGGTHVWRSFRALRRGGKVVAYGLTSTLSGGTLARGGRHRLRGVPIIGFFMIAARMVPGRRQVLLFSVQRLKRRRPDFFREDLTTLFELLREHRIAPIIAERVPLQDVRRAHQRLGSGSVSGKIILLCEERESAGTARSFGELA
jgi:NADPH2:quinone reductase